MMNLQYKGKIFYAQAKRA